MVPVERICVFILQTAEIATEFLVGYSQSSQGGGRKGNLEIAVVINRLPTQFKVLNFTTGGLLTDSGVQPQHWSSGSCQAGSVLNSSFRWLGG